VELEGAPDWVVEIVSDSSEARARNACPSNTRKPESPSSGCWTREGARCASKHGFWWRAAIRRVEPDAEGWTRSALLKADWRVTRQSAPHHGLSRAEKWRS
jgi:hypothetical protein